MKNLINKTAAQRGQIRDGNEKYQILYKMSPYIADDLAALLCGGVIGGNLTGTQVIDMCREEVGVEITRQDLKEIVAGSTKWSNEVMLRNIEL